MYIDDFIWLPHIVEKLAIKHRVTQDEVEKVSDAGRYLIVFFIYKVAHTALIISARDMNKSERRRYERK
jgi:uncharacterized DUF497 family protein